MFFQGTSALTLDGKGRLTVSARHREVLLANTGGALTLTKHPHGCLLLLPRPAWERLRENLMKLPMSAEGWRRVFIGHAVDVEMDNAARINLTPELKAAAGLDREVLLRGNGGHLELWDPRRWATYEAEATVGPMPEAIAGFVF
ncbi:MAG: division/cell wall cluster transcriptional repressor MraZ [Aquabacterium sp.]